MLIVFLVVFYCSNILAAALNWEPVDIPNDAEMKDILKAPNGNLFACFVGIYRSSDEGQTWEQVNKYEEDGQTFDFNNKKKVIIKLAATSNGYLYAINEDIYGNKLFRSKDNGENWFKLPIQISSTYPIYIDKNDRIYTQSDSNLVFSDDYGENWEILSGIGANNSIHYITEDPDGGLWLGGKRSVLYKHQDSLHFESYSSGLEQFYAVTSLLFFDDMIIGSTDEGLIISNDSAKSWKKYPTVMDGKGISSLVRNEEVTVFCLTKYDGFYRSDDSCQNWTLVGETFLHRWCNNLIISGNNYYLASQGVYKSTNKGSSWGKINDGLSKSEYKFIHYDKESNKYYLLTNGGFYYSNDDLKSWTEVVTKELNPYFTTAMYVHDDGEIFMGEYEIKHFYKSSDGGFSWQSILNRVQPQKIFGTSKGGMYMWGDTTEKDEGEKVYALYYSEPNSDRWDRIILFNKRTHFQNAGWNDWFYIYFDRDEPGDLRVYGYNSDGTLCLSLNLEKPTGASSIRTIKYMNGKTFIVDYSSGVWLASEAGGIPSQINNGITMSDGNYGARNLFFIKDDIYVSTNTGLFLSKDLGENWTETGPEPIGVPTSELYLLDDGRLYYSNSKGNFRSDPIYLSATDEISSNRNKLEISPNPSDGEFIIKFESSAEGNCCLYIYGMDGKKLYEEDFSYIRSGENELQIMNTGLNSGCYILELRFGLNIKKQLIHIYR